MEIDTSSSPLARRKFDSDVSDLERRLERLRIESDEDELMDWFSEHTPPVDDIALKYRLDKLIPKHKLYAEDVPAIIPSKATSFKRPINVIQFAKVEQPTFCAIAPTPSKIIAADISGLPVAKRQNASPNNNPTTPSDAPTTKCANGSGKSLPAHPHETIIERKAKWYNRVLFAKSKSRFNFAEHQNLNIGQLTVRKQQRFNDSLTVPTHCIDEELYSYLRMQKFPKYDNRTQVVDHMHKLACKYWQDVKKIPFSSLTGEQVNINFATVQKASDEKSNAFLLALEEQELDRRKRLVRLNKWLGDHTPFARLNHPF